MTILIIDELSIFSFGQLKTFGLYNVRKYMKVNIILQNIYLACQQIVQTSRSKSKNFRSSESANVIIKWSVNNFCRLTY